MSQTNQDDEAMELVSALVKVAIGESRIFVASYNTSWDGLSATCPEVKVVVEGDVNGTLTLRDPITRKVSKLLSVWKTATDLESRTRELAEAKRQNEALKDRLSRLHCLSDPQCSDFEE